MTLFCRLLACAVISFFFVSHAAAHFQLIYTPQSQFDRSQTIELGLIFWHPFDNGPVMDMAYPQEFYVVNKGEATDLKNTLKPTTFNGANNQAAAFRTSYAVKRGGDHIFVLVPQPYFEAGEGVYIQQITKSYINKGQFPTDWHQPQNLKTEILPLQKPYNLIAGSTFRGQVLSAGKPVPNAEIEVEYIAAAPDLSSYESSRPSVHPPPGGTLTLYSDDKGYFSFGIPKAGIWGFAALNVGPDKTYKGKALSQDALIWVHAYDLMEVE